MAACVCGLASSPSTRSSACLGSPCVSCSQKPGSTCTPGIRFCATASAKFMRSSKPAELAHSALTLAYPFGSTLRYKGSPNLAVSRARGKADCTSAPVPHHAHHHFKGGFQFGVVGALGPELSGFEHGL